MALLLGMAMLPAGAIAMQVGLNAVSVRQAALEESLASRALQSLETESQVIDEVRELVRVLATSPALQNLETSACRTWLSDITNQYNYISALAVTRENGVIVCSVPGAPPGYRSPDTDLSARARARDAFTMGYVEYGQIVRQSVLGALEPLRDARGRRMGFVGAGINVRQLQALLERDEEQDGARTALVDYSGRVIVDTPPVEGRARPSLPTSAQIRQNLGDRPRFIEAHDGSFAIVAPLQAPDVYAVVAWPSERSAMSRWLELGLPIIASLTIWLLAVAAGWFAIEVYVARPLSSLEESARRFARGEEVDDAPALASAPVEVRALRRTLAAMAKTLRGREARLVEALGEERALLREVHHRVKNNLQMVASLLNIQARGARDDSEAWGLARAHDRVQLLALVHQRIYASGEVREVRLDDIAAEVARQLTQARGSQAKDIVLDLDLAEARSGADRAVPLAFLIGEALSTALGALADAGPSQIKICLRQDNGGDLRFAIVTSGEGPAKLVSPSARLIDAFARQLGAQLARSESGPFMLWAQVPAPKDEAN